VNNKLKLLLICFSFIALANHSFAEFNLTDLVENIQPAVVTVITYDEDKKPLKQGSGFFIDDKGYVITNHHVLSEAHTAEIITYDGKRYSIKKICADDDAIDITKVKADLRGDSMVWLTISENNPLVAEQVLVIGNPLGLNQTVSNGIISAIRLVPKIGKIIQITAPISPGSSGSPVVNMEGKVLGVATFQFIEGQNLNFALPSSAISDLAQYDHCKNFKDWGADINQEKCKMAKEIVKKANSLIWNSSKKEATELLKKAIELCSNYEYGWRRLGDCYSLQDKHSEAIRAWESVLQINSENLDVIYDINHTYYFYLGEYKKALGGIKKAIRLDHEPKRAFYQLGECYHKMGEYNKAIEAFKQIIERYPHHVGAHWSLGDIYVDMGNKDAALEEYKILKELHPKSAAYLLERIID
jgi:Tfp pilus assembly protein PilF